MFVVGELLVEVPCRVLVAAWLQPPAGTTLSHPWPGLMEHESQQGPPGGRDIAVVLTQTRAWPKVLP